MDPYFSTRKTPTAVAGPTQPLLFVLLSLLLLCACAEKEDEPAYSRIQGLTTPSTAPAIGQPTATSPASIGQVNTAHLAPGKPADPSTTEAQPLDSATPAMPGGIPQAPETKVLIGGNKLQVAGIAFTVPEGWKSVKPASGFRVAQYELAGKSGFAELAVFYFGPGQGGSVEDNVKRWAGQFKSDDPTTTTVPVDVAQVSNGDLSLALVRTSGTFDPGSMGPAMGAPAAPKPKYGLLGLVVVGGPEGPVFIKATGPKGTVDEQAQNFETFARSSKKSSYK
ncbi:MAG: hypothetical protein ACR2IE_04935 [Candidatus Sumerlaeaceae bacterium]